MIKNFSIIETLGVGILCIVSSIGIISNIVKGKSNKRENACKFVNTADTVSATIVDETTGEVVETTAEDVLIPIDELPNSLISKKHLNVNELSESQQEKIKAMMKSGNFTVMMIAKKFHLARRPAYALFYHIKNEEAKAA